MKSEMAVGENADPVTLICPLRSSKAVTQRSFGMTLVNASTSSIFCPGARVQEQRGWACHYRYQLDAEWRLNFELLPIELMHLQLLRASDALHGLFGVGKRCTTVPSAL